MLVKFNFIQKNLRSQSGVALVTVIVVAAALVTASYYMFTKLDTTSKLVGKFEKKAIVAYTMKGIVAYAKDLVASRVCIDASEKTGIPTTICKLTDNGSLERLLLTSNVFLDLCTYYKNSGKPQDGLQDYCEPGKPSLLRTSFEFNILGSNISSQHPLFPLFDKSYDSSLAVKCINIKYTSLASSTASAVATVRTNVIAYNDVGCAGDIISEAGSLDVFYPRSLNSFSLISNRSLSVGSSSAESDLNSLNSSAKIIFQSPVYVNKNIYIPNTGGAADKKVIFHDKVFLAGNVRNLSNGYMTPILVDSGDLWLARYPYFMGIQNGIIRTMTEPSLTRMFDATLAPAFDGSLTAKCNDYNRRKEAAAYCNDLPRLIAKNIGSNKYSIGMSKLSELQGNEVKITSTDDSIVNYPGNLLPTKAQMSLELNNATAYLSLQSSGGEVDINLVKLGAIQLKNGNDCLTLSGPDRKICIKEGKIFTKSLNGSPKVDTYQIPLGAEANSAQFLNNDISFERKTVSNCRSNGATPPSDICDMTREVFEVASVESPSVQLKFLTTPQLTSKGTIAPQFFNLEIKIDSFDSAVFELNPSMPVLNFIAHPHDICTNRQFKYSFKIDLGSPNLLKDVTSSQWTNTDGSPVSLTSDEANYLQGEFCFFELCGSVAPPASSYASYDADWSKEAFNSFNYNPIDNHNNYVPNSSKTGYDNIFNINDNAVTNKIIIDNSYATLFNSVGIVDRCVIKSSAEIVRGFFICRYLFIEDRNNNLNMVGTFIVDKLQIGNIGSSTITWMSLFHPAARDLISNDADPKNGLKSLSNCPIDPNNPFWGMLTDGNRCDPASLIQTKSKPMTWTTFDPLCIKVPGTTTSLCKPESRSYNFEVVKIYEYFGN